MGFFDSFNQAFSGASKSWQSTVNNVVGNDYRDKYFKAYPKGPYVCKGCGRSFPEKTRECTVDHIIPQKHGGTNAITNLQILCQSCNSQKSAKINALEAAGASGAVLIRELKRALGY